MFLNQLTRQMLFEADMIDQQREKEELKLLQAEEKEREREKEKEKEAGKRGPASLKSIPSLQKVQSKKSK